MLALTPREKGGVRPLGFHGDPLAGVRSGQGAGREQKWGARRGGPRGGPGEGQGDLESLG